MDCFKVEKCSMVRRVQVWHSCWKSLNKKYVKMTLNSSAVENLYHARMGPNSNTKTHNLDAQTSSNCFEMKRRLHHGKHAPVPTILSSRHSIWNELILCLPYKMYLFKHLCYLCSIMNIILAHVIWNSFNFILFKFKKRPNISGIRVVIICYKKKKNPFEW